MSNVLLQQAREQVQDAYLLLKNAQYSNAMALLRQAAPVLLQYEEYTSYIDAENKWCECLWRLAKYHDAQEKALNTLHIALEKLGKYKPEVANIYCNLGIICYHIALYDQGIEYHQKGLQICHKLYDKPHLHTATCYSSMGNIYYLKGEFNKAIHYQQIALMIRVQILGQIHPATASSYENLGVAYFWKGEYNKAIEYYNKSLQINLQVYDEMHPSIAYSYGNLGNVYYHKGEYAKSIHYQRKSLFIKLHTLGEIHPATASSYGNLGLVYCDNGDYDKAIQYQQKNLFAKLQTIGENHPNIAFCYTNIGIAYYKKGEHLLATQYIKKSIFLRVNLFHDEMHPLIAIDYNHLGLIAQAQGNYSKAIEHHQKSLHINLQKLGEINPNTASCHCLIADCYTQKKQYVVALQRYQLAINANYYDFNSNDIYAIPPLFGQLSSRNLLETLQGKADCFWLYYQNQTLHVKDLHATIQTFYATDDLIEQMRNDFFHEGSKLIISNNAYKVSESALNALWELQTIQKNDTFLIQ